MRTSQMVILTLAAIVILSATQLPMAATLQTRADYGAAMDQISAEYKDAHDECGPITGHDKAMCVAEAKAAEMRARAAANAKYWGTIKAKVESRIANADAGWLIARASCDAKRQTEKEACVNLAKSENIRLVAAAEIPHAK